MQTKTPFFGSKTEKFLGSAFAGSVCGGVLDTSSWTGIIIGAVIGFLLELGGQRAEQKSREKERRDG